ncbi:hypothetical protein J0S82_010674 [Galemys pyrenaicus]|uniref:Uncharacterized protein n=1 Tax=Galemys pyrenaicus TaxID=202257 RepID=A0A8J6A1K7_GALPY|nr:hypothetical protein J0S82_010674 [Galemys pyrenaicus]
MWLLQRQRAAPVQGTTGTEAPPCLLRALARKSQKVVAKVGRGIDRVLVAAGKEASTSTLPKLVAVAKLDPKITSVKPAITARALAKKLNNLSDSEKQPHKVVTLKGNY